MAQAHTCGNVLELPNYWASLCAVRGVDAKAKPSAALRKQLEEARSPPAAPYTLRPTPCTLQSTPYALRPTPYALRPTPVTIQLTFYTLRPANPGEPLGRRRADARLTRG